MIYPDYQINGLEKLVNNSQIMEIYPMIEKIEIKRPKIQPYLDSGREVWTVNVFVNDPNIVDEKSMYKNNLDPIYLTDYHMVQLFPYLGIDKVPPPIMNVIVRGVNERPVFTWEY